MSRSFNTSKRTASATAKRYSHPHKHQKYDQHKLAAVVSHNRYERNHGGEAAK